MNPTTAKAARNTALSRIVLHHARGPGFPAGSSRHGYEIVAPLDRVGQLNAAAWSAEREKCTVRRFWGDNMIMEGRLVHHAGGADGATWMLDYDPQKETDDEAGFRLDNHRFAPGEYVTISDNAGRQHTFVVAEVMEERAKAG